MGKGIAEILAGEMEAPAAPEEEVKGDEMGLDAAANSLIAAVAAKDTAGVVGALRDAFAIMQSEDLGSEEEEAGSLLPE